MCSAFGLVPKKMLSHTQNTADVAFQSPIPSQDFAECDICLQQHAHVRQISIALQPLSQQVHASVNHNASMLSAISRPDKYSRDPAMCYGFLLMSEQAKKITYLLTGYALTWATAVWKVVKIISGYEQLEAMFYCVFDHSPDGQELSKMSLCSKDLMMMSSLK